MRNLTSVSLTFTENRGQWDERALFRADAGGAAMWFTADGVYYQFVRPARGSDDTFEQLVVKTTIVGANPAPRVSGAERLAHRNNYFTGDDPSGWHTDVPNFRAIVFEGVYDGIDLQYYGNGERMEYDFIVAPGADHTKIEIEYEGVRSLSVNTAGELEVATEWGVLKELAPRVYQDDGGGIRKIASTYRIQSETSFGFELHDKYNAALPLVIDPGLYFGTCLGSTGDDMGYAIAIDDEGFAYVTGYTYSLDFPTHVPAQPFAAGIYDVFVAKINPFGSGLLYSTYLGGSGGEHCYAIAVDDDGCAYVTGATASTNFPTKDAFQPAPPICDGDAFVTKLNDCGNDLVFSTYLGGNDVDWGTGICVDDDHYVYVAGTTQSTDFPTQGPFQTDSNAQDGYVVKFTPAADSLVYGTYVGGDSIDFVWALSVDDGGHACITGVTISSDFPTVNEFQTDMGGRDAFVTKLTPSGGWMVFSTYLGGNNYDRGRGIATDAAGNVYVTGNTQSFDFPTVNPFRPWAGYDDAIVTKFGPTGGAPIYSTYLGSNSYDLGYDVEVDAGGHAYVAGWTRSTYFPLENEYQTHQDTSDAFVTKFNPEGDDLVYSTYLGGNSADEAWGIALAPNGDAYVTGYTMSSDFPTQTPYQTHQGGKDAFVARLSDSPSSIDDAQPPGTPERYALHQNVPNPFNPSTMIHYELPAGGGEVSIAIYDVSGRLVRTLVEGLQSAGRKTAVWNGRDHRGQSAASGVYFYRMTAPDFVKTRKMVLLR